MFTNSNKSVQLIKDMAFPARFVAVKPPPEAYEQRLKDSGQYSEEDISSLLGQAPMDIEGSELVVVNEEVGVAATILDDFIYERAGQDGRGEEMAEEMTNKEQVGEVEERMGENGERIEEEKIEVIREEVAEEQDGAVETNGDTAREGVDQEMKDGPTDT